MDRYGGTTANRIRFATEVVTAVAEAIGAGRTALRLSPGDPQFGMVESDPGPVYRMLVDGSTTSDSPTCTSRTLTPTPPSRTCAGWSGTLIANVGENRAATTRNEAEKVLSAGVADAVSFGRGFLVNPDLPARLAGDLPWNTLNDRHLYTWGPEGYIDYPTYDPCRQTAVGA